MQKITVNSKKYSYPTYFSECKVSLAIDCVRVWDMQTKTFKDNLREKPEEIKRSDWYYFLVNWVEAVAKVPYEVCEKIHEIDLNVIWGQTKFILLTPDNIEIKDKLKGVEITESIETISGKEVVGGKITYEQWALLNRLNVSMVDCSEEKRIDLLKKMITVVYLVDDESKKDLSNRLESYNSLNLEELHFGFYFFKSVLEWVENSFPVLKAEPYKSKEQKKAMKKSSVNPIVKHYRDINIWDIYAHNLAKTGALSCGFDVIIKMDASKVLKHIEIEKSYEH